MITITPACKFISIDANPERSTKNDVKKLKEFRINPVKIRILKI